MKKKTILFLVLMLLFLALLTNYSQGQEKGTGNFINGNDYLSLAEESKLFYVMGLIDMLWLQTFHYNYEEYPALEEATDGMIAGQIKAIFDKYLEEHPEDWQYTAASSFAVAIFEIVEEKK